jgi:AcrR family transcriptional regulator
VGTDEVKVRARDTKAEIRTTAIRLIAAKGFEQTSMREIGDAVGITKASLYYHYSSKLDILLAIVEPILAEMRLVVASLPDQPRTDAGVQAVLSRYIGGLIRHRDGGSLFVRDTIAIVNAVVGQHPEIADASRELYAWLAGPDPSTETQLRAVACLEVLGVALTSAELVPDASEAEVAEVLLDAALRVLRCGS